MEKGIKAEKPKISKRFRFLTFVRDILNLQVESDQYCPVCDNCFNEIYEDVIDFFGPIDRHEGASEMIKAAMDFRDMNPKMKKTLDLLIPFLMERRSQLYPGRDEVSKEQPKESHED